ncbi:MAG: HD domain-containing protein [Candidatus Parcubacteria bacterium]|nr:HD domain-containing protein [Candidatus Parcubacteria bacterium]
MKLSLQKTLFSIASEMQVKGDPSHDFSHVERVLHLAVDIAKTVNADLDIVIPAALFHDIIVYKKDSKESKNEANESADVAEKVLRSMSEYPNKKVESVKTCITQCSFSKGITPTLLEAKVLQDADRLEATGAISIMRTFASCGQMGRPFYSKDDPLCKKEAIPFRSGIDLFYNRLLIVESMMHTKYTKKIARQRTKFLKQFLAQFEKELKESGIIE